MNQSVSGLGAFLVHCVGMVITFENLLAAVSAPTRLRVLYLLIENGPTTMGDLAGAAGLSPGALTSVVAALREVGLVETWPDRRRVGVRSRVRGLELIVDWLPGDEPYDSPL